MKTQKEHSDVGLILYREHAGFGMVLARFGNWRRSAGFGECSVAGKLTIEMVGVGHGDCFALKWEPTTGDPSVVVIDGGPQGGGLKLDAALRSLDTNKINLMVLSHTDADHVDGLLEYARLGTRPLIERYWGPCLPAFERHRWLFADRVQRGLDVAASLEREIGGEAVISWPLEHASWDSDDGGLRIRVLSPAGRLIERLLVGADADALFLEQPMPIAWLLDPNPDDGLEDAYADLRAAIASAEVDPTRVPADLPPSRVIAGRKALAAEAARDFGIDPEFFGNSVLNDTSLVLLVEVDLGGAPKRMLFTGDLQTFTYLIANYPMGLGLEMAKAPHHGSRSHLGGKLGAYDEVWQWLRPRAVLVSAGGKHGLPKSDFRNAVLRSGASLFCACRRGKEILIGSQVESSCHAQFSCSPAESSVRIEMGQDGFIANAQACGSSSAAGPAPVIQMVQHLVDPSAVLDRLTMAERDKHVRWVTNLLERRHCERVWAGGETGLTPLTFVDLEREATAGERFRAAAAMEIVLEAAARTGKVWLSRSDRGRHVARSAWIMPNKEQWRELSGWLADHAVILLAIPKRITGRTARELLLAADTGYLASRVAERFAFPEAMFADAIWPRLSKLLLEQGWRVSSREIEEPEMTAVMCAPAEVQTAFVQLVARLPDVGAKHYLEQLSSERYYETASLPDALIDLVAPYWLAGRPIRPRVFADALRSNLSEEHLRVFCDLELATSEDRELLLFGRHADIDPKAARRLLAAFLIGGFRA